ncbi:MIZ zinc finger family protein, partial [Aphelenchoides avenae]
MLCPVGRRRIEIPVRTRNCSHLQCFDLATYLKAHDRDLLAVKRYGKSLLSVDSSIDQKYISWSCPVCKKQAEVGDLCVDGYFDSLLQKYNGLENIEEAEILPDGSHRPAVQTKMEVVPVSDSPFFRAYDGEDEQHIDEKPLAPDHP